MAGRFLLDTNIVIAHFEKEVTINDRISRSPEVFIPAVVIGELFYGFTKSLRVSSNLPRLEQFIRKSSIVICDTATARIYGRLKHELKLMGRPIPDNDLWIAACANQHGLTLVTRDAHFDSVPDISIENW